MQTTRRTAARGVLAGLALTVLGLPLGSPAEAHTDLVSSTPAAGATVGAGVTALALTFDEPLVAEGTQILVRDAAGTNHASTPSTLGPESRVRLGTLTRPGTYSVAYRAVAGDGHPISGSYEFRVTAKAGADRALQGADVTTALPTTPTGGSLTSGWLVAGLGASGLAALLIVGARRRPEDEGYLADDRRP
jgi:methionine-rich copper-binding protein CopC